jgi:hypothetical protein
MKLKSKSISSEILQHFLLEEEFNLEKLRRESTRFNPFYHLMGNSNGAHHLVFWKWLLDPNQNHGCRDWFLRKLVLSAYHIPAAIKNQIQLSNHSYTEVHNQYNHQDLVIENRRSGWALLVGAAPEEDLPIDHLAIQYQQHSQRDFAPQAYVHYILLATRPHEARRLPGMDGYDTILFNEVHQWLGEGLSSLELDEPIALFIDHYKRYLKLEVMSAGKELRNLAQQIYWKHKSALDYILANRPILNTPEHFQDVFKFFREDERYAALTPQKDEIFRFLPVIIQDKFRYGSYSWHHMYEMFCLEMVFEDDAIMVKFTFGGIWHKDAERREYLQQLKDSMFDTMQRFESLQPYLSERGHSRGKYPAVALYPLMHLSDLEEAEGDFMQAFLHRFDEFERTVLWPWTEEVSQYIPDRPEIS